MKSATVALVMRRFTIHTERPDATLTGALCATCVDVLGLPGAGISLHSPSGDMYSIGVSDPVMAEIQELERMLGEGPCVDAWMRGEPVGEPDLANPADASRWIEFTSGALRVGARASFGYPLQIGSTRFGALNLYDTEPGAFSPERHESALVLADRKSVV